MNQPSDQKWMNAAACRGQPDELFFATEGRSLAEAKRVCVGCDVKVECLDWALHGRPAEAVGGNPRDVFGTWGGTTKPERERLLRYIARVKCPVCAGTHLRQVDVRQVCLDCGQSWTTIRPSSQTRLKADVAV